MYQEHELQATLGHVDQLASGIRTAFSHCSFLPMTSFFTVAETATKHQLYISKRMISAPAQHHVSAVEDIASLITSMNDLTTPENKIINIKRILMLRAYVKLLNALHDHGPLSSINKMYLNQIVDLDFSI